MTEIVNHKLQDIPEFRPFFDAGRWFNSLIIIFPETIYGDLGRFVSNDAQGSMGKLLNYFDTGIETVNTEIKPIDEALSFLPEDFKNDVIHEVQEGFEGNGLEVPSGIDATIAGKRCAL